MGLLSAFLMVIQQEGACAYHQQQASGGIRGGSGSAGGGEVVVDDFFVVESGLTVERTTGPVALSEGSKGEGQSMWLWGRHHEQW